MQKIRAIVFDAYGTLFDIATIDERLAHHYGDHAASIGPVWRQKQLEYTWLRTLMDRYEHFYTLTADALRYACEAAGARYDDAVTADLMDHYNRLRVYPEVEAALARLKEKYRLAILSNANMELLAGAVAYNHIGRHLTSVFSVDGLRKFKPVPAVYQLPEQGLRLPKEQIAFVSSNTWDVAGAKAYGLYVIWVRRGDKPAEQLGPPPDLVVADLAELVLKVG